MLHQAGKRGKGLKGAEGGRAGGMRKWFSGSVCVGEGGKEEGGFGGF